MKGCSVKAGSARDTPAPLPGYLPTDERTLADLRDKSQKKRSGCVRPLSHPSLLPITRTVSVTTGGDYAEDYVSCRAGVSGSRVSSLVCSVGRGCHSAGD